MTASGANLTNRNPASVNNLGADAKVVDAPGVVPNGATSTNVTFSTTGDFYYPAVLTTQIDLYAPTITGTKSVSNLNGNTPGQGRRHPRVHDVVHQLRRRQRHQLGRSRTPCRPTPPTSRARCPSSPAPTPAPRPTPRATTRRSTSPASRLVRYRVGTGATAATGGVLAKNGTTRVRFQVTVDTRRRRHHPDQLGQPALHGRDDRHAATPTRPPTSRTPVATLADLSLTKTATPATVTAGNTSPTPCAPPTPDPTAAADVVITDTLPTGATLRVQHARRQGACTPSGQTLTCAVGTVANGADATVTVVVARPRRARRPPRLTNVAEVTSSTSDPNTDQQPRLRHDHGDPLRRRRDHQDGQQPDARARAPSVTYTLVATNNGASTAANVVVTDSLPTAFSGLTATTTAGTCTVTGNGVSCPVGSLAPGDSATVRITATLDSSYTGGALSNRAQVQSDTTDPVTAQQHRHGRRHPGRGPGRPPRRQGDRSPPRSSPVPRSSTASRSPTPGRPSPRASSSPTPCRPRRTPSSRRRPRSAPAP